MPIEGTYQNAVMGNPPDGENVSLWMVNIWKVVDGKAVQRWTGADTLAL